MQGHGPVAGTFSGSNAEKTVRFTAHFEKTDAAQVKFDHAEAQGVCAVEPRVRFLHGGIYQLFVR